MKTSATSKAISSGVVLPPISQDIQDIQDVQDRVVRTNHGKRSRLCAQS